MHRFLFFLFFSYLFLNAEQLTDSFRLDGYGNIEMIHSNLDRDKLNPSGGFQGRYQITEDISITGQIHIEEGNNVQGIGSNSLKDYDSELKWFYIDYYLKNDFSLRAGAFQFPVFKASETGDIGYTYTWTDSPLRYYGVFGCDDFKGVELLKNFSYGDFDFLAQLSYGKSENELNDGRGESRDGDVKDLVALTLKTSHEDFIFNIGYLQAKSKIDTSNRFINIDQNVDFNMIAIESEVYINDTTFKAGFIKTNLTNVFPEDIKYYLSLEHNIDDFTPYILYSNELLKFKNNPINTNDRRLNIKEQKVESYSLGLRYDYNSNIALKASYSHEVSSGEYDGFRDSRDSNDILMGTINVIF